MRTALKFFIINLLIYSGLLIWGGYMWGGGAAGAIWILYGIIWCVYILLSTISIFVRLAHEFTDPSKVAERFRRTRYMR